ncbi:MAG TPA: protein translocase SEC61 complex subunit gamma [Candidatus Thermoplasmatota archaeon]|nr:protein translocase SEC61 complex subunit gamma [Candidatus Thermoplasmatota archaeon]
MSTAHASTASSTTQHERSLVDKAWEAQEKLESRVSQLGRGKYGRVLRMARKPSKEEFRKAMIVGALGIVFVGAIGFVMYLIFNEVGKLVGM